MAREAPHSVVQHVLERSCRELAARLQRGEAAGAEDYLARFPAVASDTEAAVELIYAEFIAREDLGQRPTVEEFLTRFSPWRERLARQLTFHTILSDAPPGEGEGESEPEDAGREDSWLDLSQTSLFAPLVRRPGSYRIVREVGRGATSVIFEALQAGTSRRVALKCIDDGGRADPEARRRLLSEARTAAMLQHPNIVQVFEVGVQDDVPFLALEFVEGQSLGRWLKDARPAPRRAARIAETLARALQYAHGRQVIHRDLSPANVLLTADGTPKITDFGLALRLGRTSRRAPLGAILGTPGYMAPEQAGGVGEATAAADIHALGAILYEMLTGVPPFPAEPTMDALQRLLEDAPVPPRRLRRETPAALEVICLKCLEKDPARRYASAGALADDLARFARGEAIHARLAAWPVRALRLARQQGQGPVGLLAPALLVTAVLLGSLGWWLLDLRRDLATLRRQLDAEVPRARALALAERRAERATRLDRRNRYTLDLRRAQQALVAGDRRLATDLLDGLRPWGDTPDPRGFEWYTLVGRLNRPISILPAAHRSAVYAAAVAPDGLRFATGDLQGTLVIWDATTLQPLRAVPAHEAAVTHLRFTPDGTRLVSACGDERGRHQVSLRDAATLKDIGEPIALREPLHHLDLAADGRTLVVREGDPADHARLWGVTAEGLRPLRGDLDEARHLAVSPDGRRLAVATPDGRVLIGPVDRPGGLVATLPADAGRVEAMAWRPDGTELVVATAGRALLRIDPDRGALRGTPLADRDRVVQHLQYSPKGATLVAVDTHGLTVRDGATGAPLRTCELPGGAPLAWWNIAPGGQTALAGDANGEATRWYLRTGVATPVPRGGDVPVRSGAYFPADQRAVMGTEDGRPWFWSPLPGDPQSSAHQGEAWCVAFTPSGKLAASGGDDHRVRLWAVGERRLTPVRTLEGHTSTVSSLAFTPSGDQLVSGDLQGGLILWNPHAGGRGIVLNPPREGSQVRSLRIAADGRTLVTAGSDGVVRLWDLADRAMRSSLRAHDSKARAVAVAPDGRRMASVGNDAVVIQWELEAGTARELWRRPLPAEGASLAYAPDGRTLAVGLVSGRIELRETATGARRADLPGHRNEVRTLTFTPDGETLVSGSLDGSVRTWDPVTGLERLLVRLHRAGVYDVAVSADGTRLLSCDHNGEVRLTLAPRDPPAQAQALAPREDFDAEGDADEVVEAEPDDAP
jgi:WD40 repeat protein